MSTLPFEICRAYLLAHAASPREANEQQLLRAVTISRETGAGAITVARMLMDDLEKKHGGDPRYPWAVFDRELVKRVLKDHRLPETLEPYLPEDSPSRVNDVIEDLMGIHPSDWTLVQHTKETIFRLAMAGNVILVGRGANLVTSKLDHVLHIRLIAPLDFRVRHIQEFYELTSEEAADFVRREDRARNRYVRTHFQASVQDPLQYHLTINTGRIGFPETARLIAAAVLNPQSVCA